MSSDNIRPRGTVEVPCSKHNDLAYGCRVCWPDGHPGQVFFWVDALDPRLPDGPFACDACEAGGISNHLVCGVAFFDDPPVIDRVRCQCPPDCDHDSDRAERMAKVRHEGGRDA